MNFRIPFNKCYFSGKELDYIQDAIEQMHISGDGIYTRKCAHLLQEILSVPQVLLTTSCTHALEMAALLLDIQPGDEVIVPSFTFVSTVNAFVLRGARPVFVDIRDDTLNLDEKLIASVINPRTSAIIPVHYAGVGCDMASIREIASSHAVAIVEDNAHGLFGKYRGQYLGSFGTLATQSFHETKNFTCGEGGALIVNDPQYAERAEIIREKGTNRSRFFRGEIDKYTWVDIGSSYLPSDMLAAFLWAQLEMRTKIQTKRAAIWNFYNRELAVWAMAHDVRLPFIPADCEQSFHMFYLVMPNEPIRRAFMKYLKEHGISTVFHYVPLHLSAMGRTFGWTPHPLPVTERVSKCLVRLPFHNYLNDADLAYTVEVISQFSA